MEGNIAALGDFKVRAIDLGYGNVKFSLSHTDSFGPIKCGIFPSRSPVAGSQGLASGLLQGRDTAIIQINNTNYEVGKGVAMAQGAHDITENLDKDFCLSDAYLARLRGALHYIQRSSNATNDDKISLLVVGLPVATSRNKAMKAKLAALLTGHHQLANGQTVEVEQVLVLPQPMGAFFEYAFMNGMLDSMKHQNNLVIDPGYFTFDWLSSGGVVPIDARSDSVNRGVSAVLQAIVENMNKTEGWDAEPAMLVRMLDDHFRTGRPFSVYGKEVYVPQYMYAGRGVINEAVAALRNNVGDGADIQNIILAGGGAKLYLEAVQEKFPRHKIIVMETPVYSNVRGFQLAGESQALGLLRRQRLEAKPLADSGVKGEIDSGVKAVIDSIDE